MSSCAPSSTVRCGRLPEQVILLSVVTEPRPWVPGNDALEVQPLRSGIGFMQSAHVPKLIARCGLEVGDDVTYPPSASFTV